MDEAKALSLLGIAMRAGQVISGDDTVERAVRAGRVALVLLDAGASENTREKYHWACRAKALPLYEISADQLGRAIGKPGRRIAAVKRGSLAERVKALLDDINP